jgi:bifunctional dethiobiotin synthetase / adenosylmethionine---8-amino-7-oxononanoate aminotransferase
VPLCATLASESVFKAFESEDKADALLHGHSYTAHPVGCQVAVESLKQMEKMDSNGQWDWAKNAWQVQKRRSKSVIDAVWSIWHQDFILWLSQHQAVAGAWALGSVLAIHMRAPEGAGYTSTAAVKLRDALKSNASPEGSRPWNVHSRVLGNVIYIMGSQGTTETAVQELRGLIQEAIQNLRKCQ